jgi:hypothetical protein
MLPFFIRSALLLPVICLIFFPALRYGRREQHLPPRPQTIPILGNAHMMLTEKLHLKYDDSTSTPTERVLMYSG